MENSESGPARREVLDRLVARVSVRFANAPDAAIAGEVERTLRELCGALDLDRCTYGEFDPHGSLNVVCAVDAPAPAGARAGTDIGLRSHLTIPVAIAGRIVGELSFGSVRARRSWPDELIDRVRALGELLAWALARMRLEAETRQLRDTLWQGDRSARVGLLTSMIAREINQPLTAILSNVQAGLRYLDRGRLTESEIRSILQAVERDTRRAAESIRAMRGFMRRHEPRRAAVGLDAAVGEVLRLLDGELERQGIDLQARLVPGCRVNADRAQLQQVVLDLVLNAAAAMQALPRDDRKLFVTVDRADDGSVVVAVRDSGPGIAADEIDAVFEPFWMKRRHRFGLGLAMCRAIVEAHGGTISVQANPDRGVTFRFGLDALADAADPASDERPASAAGFPERPAGTALVCVVDRDASARASVVRLLRAAGLAVSAFASRESFLATAPLPDVACLLLASENPRDSLPDLQARLHAVGAAPQIVVVSADADMAAGVDAMKRGAVDVLTKPVDGSALLQALRVAIDRHVVEHAHTIEREQAQARLARLTDREREVTRHVVRGRLNKQIAADLGISEQTVKQHRGRAMEKMRVRSLAELVRICEAGGLAS
jgi:FixJ family two-component response regulator/signal transduction histidine kinase